MVLRNSRLNLEYAKNLFNTLDRFQPGYPILGELVNLKYQLFLMRIKIVNSANIYPSEFRSNYAIPTHQTAVVTIEGIRDIITGFNYLKLVEFLEIILTIDPFNLTSFQARVV